MLITILVLIYLFRANFVKKSDVLQIDLNFTQGHIAISNSDIVFQHFSHSILWSKSDPKICYSPS